MITRIKYTYKTKALATLLLGLFFLFPSFAQEAKKIKIRKADSQEYRKENGNDVFWLVGNVEYEHEGAIMNCDSSIYFKNENRFNAYGNVRIRQGDSLVMTGRTLLYNGNTGLLHITQDVNMTDGNMQLFCDEITFNRKENLAYYTTGGQLLQADNVLTSKRGYYNTASQLFVFKDSVHLTNPKYNIISDTLRYASNSKVAYFAGPTEIHSDSADIYCENGNYDTQNDVAILKQNSVIRKGAQTIKGDSIYYRVKQGYGDITGHAYISDTLNKYVITGGHATYREVPEYAEVTINPMYAIQIEDDSLFIVGKTITVSPDSAGKRLVRVKENSRFYKSDFQGKSDSLTYAEADSTFTLYHNPVLWNEKTQLTADYIFMTTKKGNLDSLYMLDNAFMIAMEDSTRYNQIKGRNMYGKFIDNELRTIFVAGNGQTVYYAYDEEDKQIGVNRADCSDLIIRIEESKVDHVTFLKKPNATLYPPGRIPKGELFLKGFRQRFNEQIHSKEELMY